MARVSRSRGFLRAGALLSSAGTADRAATLARERVAEKLTTHSDRHNEMPSADPLPRFAGLAVLRRPEASDLVVFQEDPHHPPIAPDQDWVAASAEAETSVLLARLHNR